MAGTAGVTTMAGAAGVTTMAAAGVNRTLQTIRGCARLCAAS
jgi:hypothetical protein